MKARRRPSIDRMGSYQCTTGSSRSRSTNKSFTATRILRVILSRRRLHKSIQDLLTVKERVANKNDKVAMNLDSYEYVAQLILSSDLKEKQEVLSAPQH